MKLVIFGLTISSSWGNGHATLWRGLCRALARRGHHIVFFERDVPYYAQHRDLVELPGIQLRLYSDWGEESSTARRELLDADVGMITSYCPDGVAASELVLDSRARLKVFYDLDTPVTLESIQNGRPVDYIGPRGFADFDLVLSYTGGRVLEEIKARLGARRAVPLYGSVDPESHKPARANEAYRADFSYLGTYAADRQAALETFFIEPARQLPLNRFVLAGAMYPQNFPWTKNMLFVRHLPPPGHPAFFSSSRLTLNVTRAAMAARGYCPSGRLFEAAACGTPVLSDWWEGLGEFFEPGSEIIVGRSSTDTIAALQMSPEELAKIGNAARERALAEHTAEHRAEEFEATLADALRREDTRLMEV